MENYGIEMKGNLSYKLGSNVASAGAMTLGSGNIFNITGVTTINTIATKDIGTPIILQFDGILQLTHSADLVLPGGANITTAVGDIAIFYEYAAGDWRCISYQKVVGLGNSLDSESDVILSGTPIVMKVVIAGVPYYWKVYPTKT